MANKIIIVVALIVALVLSLTAKDEGYYADNTTLSSDVNGGKMTQPLVSGAFTFALENNKLVLYDYSVALWSSRDSGPGSYLVMQSDGNLVLYDSSNKAFWNTKSNGRGVGPFTLKLNPDGTLQIIDKNNIITFEHRFLRVV